MSLLPTPSYPEPLYHGDTGENTATVRRRDHKPDITYPTGVTVDYLATGESTDGMFGLYRWNFGPDESGPDAHFHKTMSESFFILEGAVRLYNGEEWLVCKSGDYLYVPPGGVHGFKNVPGEKASMLLLFTPGAPREAYFEGLLAMRQGMELTDEEKTAFFQGHDNW